MLREAIEIVDLERLLTELHQLRRVVASHRESPIATAQARGEADEVVGFLQQPGTELVTAGLPAPARVTSHATTACWFGRQAPSREAGLRRTGVGPLSGGPTPFGSWLCTPAEG